MGERGPRTKSNLSVVSPTIKKRPVPPRGMSMKSRGIWLRVVRAYPIGHFKPQHYDLLRMYCGACVLQKEAEEDVIKTGAIITQKNGVTKENPSINIAVKFEASATRLATKLGITINNTTVSRGKAGSGTKYKSLREGLIYRRGDL